MKEWDKIISKNIVEYRKRAKLTQSELAEKLNFSDKSISKWERGEAIPDVVVLINMSEIFGITLNDLISENNIKPVCNNVDKVRNRILITLLSAGVAWLVATLVFVVLMLVVPELNKSWLAFIYAIPVSVIILLIFACIWGKKWQIVTLASLINWTIIIALCLTFDKNIWQLIYIAIPMQVLIILFGLLHFRKKKVKKGKTNKNIKEEEIKNVK